jgi:virginiamycin B lyase
LTSRLTAHGGADGCDGSYVVDAPTRSDASDAIEIGGPGGSDGSFVDDAPDSGDGGIASDVMEVCSLADASDLNMIDSDSPSPDGPQTDSNDLSEPVGFSEFDVPTLNAGPNGIVAAADGTVWFAEIDANQIGSITAAGIFREFPVPAPNASPDGISVAPDGTIWYASLATGRLIRMTRDGETTQSAPLGDNPNGLCWGPDANLWFGMGAQNVGRFGPAGALTTFPLPGMGPSTAISFDVGSDGNLWFTELDGNRIGSITSLGVVREFELPTKGSTPIGITAGPDGALWFTEYAADRIGRLTVEGKLSEFPIPTPDSFPVDIASGREGGVWFTGNQANTIGRVDLDGSIHELAVPTRNAAPVGITVAPDGSVWFTERAANRIGRYRPAATNP